MILGRGIAFNALMRALYAQLKTVAWETFRNSGLCVLVASSRPKKTSETEQVAVKTSGDLASSGANDRTRTGDLRITSALLYQLSHVGLGFRRSKAEV